MAERLPESQFIQRPFKRIYENIASCFNVLLDQVTTLELTDHTQGTDTALGTLGTKDPAINADKVIYRDSVTSDALVTSTWTQIKAFLKTYFDTFTIYTSTQTTAAK